MTNLSVMHIRTNSKKNKKQFPCIILKVNLQTKQTTTSLVKNITIDVEVERLRELCTSYH